MKRHPFLILSLAIAGAAVLHAVLSPALPPAPEPEGKLPPGMVCTACGPIARDGGPQLLSQSLTLPGGEALQFRILDNIGKLGEKSANQSAAIQIPDGAAPEDAAVEK